MQIRLIDARTIEELVTIHDVVEAVHQAFAAYGRGEARMPPKVYLDVEGGDFRAMPAALGELAGLKWVNVHPANPERGLPTVMATIVLNEAATGRPLAIIEGTTVTRMRTGAAAAVATRALARPGAKTLGIIGCGGQAATHIRALRDVMPVERLILADLNADLARQRAAEFPDLACEIADAETAVREADVVCTLTPARRPFLKADWLHPGLHVNAMGADAAGKQELEAEALAMARVFVDDWAQASHSGEINVAVSEGRLDREGLAGVLPEVIAGAAPGRTDDAEITLFDSTGLAIQDLAVARLAWERAEAQGLGRSVEL